MCEAAAIAQLPVAFTVTLCSFPALCSVVEVQSSIAIRTCGFLLNIQAETFSL